MPSEDQKLFTPAKAQTAGSTKPSIEKPIPEDIKTKVFDTSDGMPEGLEDIPVAQLPAHTIDTSKKAEEPKKEEVKKEESKTEEKSEEAPTVEKKAEDKRAEVPPKKVSDISSILKPPTGKESVLAKKDESVKIDPAAPKGKVTRDYSGHSAEEVSAFKQMSDESYAFTKKLITEKKALEGLKDSSYLQHPNGFQLSPQFQQLQSDIIWTDKEAKIWAEQLEKIKAGEKWAPLIRWDDKTGAPIYGPEQDASGKAEELARANINICLNAQQKAVTDLQSYQGKFKNQITQDEAEMRAVQSQYFLWHSKPEVLDYSVEVANVDGSKSLKTIKTIKEEFKSLFPDYHRGNILLDIAADLMVNQMITKAQLNEALQDSQVAQVKQEEAVHIEPSSKERPRNGDGTFARGNGTFDIEGMPDN